MKLIVCGLSLLLLTNCRMYLIVPSDCICKSYEHYPTATHYLIVIEHTQSNNFSFWYDHIKRVELSYSGTKGYKATRIVEPLQEINIQPGYTITTPDGKLNFLLYQYSLIFSKKAILLEKLIIYSYDYVCFSRVLILYLLQV